MTSPTSILELLIRNVWLFDSMKFGSKLMYLDYLHELAQHLQLDQLIIPPAVRKWVTRMQLVVIVLLFCIQPHLGNVSITTQSSTNHTTTCLI